MKKIRNVCNCVEWCYTECCQRLKDIIVVERALQLGRTEGQQSPSVFICSGGEMFTYSVLLGLLSNP